MADTQAELARYAQGPAPVHVAVIGVGGVGKCLLKQLGGLCKASGSSSVAIVRGGPGGPVPVVTVLVSRSSKSVASSSFDRPLALVDADGNETWQDFLAQSGSPAVSPLDAAEFLKKAPGPAVLIDNTASEAVAQEYPKILAKGVSVVTPNKKGFSSSQDLWNAIFAAVHEHENALVFHESTVGAGLPIISTLRDLVDSGDKVLRVEGVFSGTMSFLFGHFQPAGPVHAHGRFSAEVSNAKELGFTEPDPRDDLNGMDVARKLTILARIIGLQVSGPDAFPVESLIPPELVDCKSADEFMARLPEFDDRMSARREEAASGNEVVRYVGSIDVPSGKLKVGVERLDCSHPIANLKGSDNLIAFYTERYGSNPLIVQGAGAGGDVTAMGVLADLIRAARLLTTKRS